MNEQTFFLAMHLADMHIGALEPIEAQIALEALERAWAVTERQKEARQ